MPHARSTSAGLAAAVADGLRYEVHAGKAIVTGYTGSKTALVIPATLGGYPVLKKWLSYRESALLGRPLTSDEAQSFTHHIRRITAILALHTALDAHYAASV